jgi:hypothetical protein
MISLLLTAILGLSVDFQPSPVFPSSIPLAHGQYVFQLDSNGNWRRSFTAQQDGTVYVYMNQPAIPVYSNVGFGTNDIHLSTSVSVLGKLDINVSNYQQNLAQLNTTSTPDFICQVSKYDSFTLRVHDEPYTEFAVIMNPEPATVLLLGAGMILVRRRSE